MGSGDSEPAVRILSAHGGGPDGRGDRDDLDRPRRSWMLPSLAAAIALLAFVGLTTSNGEQTAMPTTTTLPPGLSAVSTELIDISSPSGAPPVTEEWVAIDFPGPAAINGIIEFDGSLTAFGTTTDGAGAWTSGSGTGWRDVPRFESPDATKSTVDHVTVWKGTIVALGSVADRTGVWTARDLSRWAYHGHVPEMEVDALVGIAASDEVVLAITATPLGHEVWTSADGINWTSFGDVADLEEMTASSVHYYDGFFYAPGAERCGSPPCRPVIYRSANGITWMPTAGVVPEVSAANRGEVVDIVPTGEVLLATGHTDGDVAVWQSSDGSQWNRIAADQGALRATTLSLQLEGISAADESVADLAVDDRQHRVTVGSQLLTDVGMITIAAVENDSIAVELVDGSIVRLEPGSPWTTSRRGFPASIAARGKRIVIAGSVALQDTAAPAVWTSDDGGLSWQIRATEDWREGRLTGAATIGRNIAVTGATSDDVALVWRSAWDTSAQEEAGLRLLETYFAAVEAGNVDNLLRVLPSQAGSFQIPSLGRSTMKWWGDDGNRLDAAAAAATLDYLSALDTRIVVEDCNSQTQFRDIESVRVTCGFMVDSDLLRMYSPSENPGTAEAVVEDGVLQLVRLNAAPSDSLWQMLVNSTVDAAPEDRATLVGQRNGVESFEPTFTGDTAAAHLRLATELAAGLLRPGDTRVVETSLGTMEWTWIEQIPVPVYAMTWIAPFADGFIAVGEGNDREWTEEVSLWFTEDGFEWQQIPGPEGVNSLWSLQPFRDGLIGQAWREESQLLVYFDGSTWTTINLPEPPNERFNDMSDFAVSGDRLMVLTQYWSGSGDELLDIRAWMLGDDGALEPVAMLPDLSPEEETLGLVGYDDGFLLASARFGSARQMAVWHSADGQTWTEIAATTTLEDAAYVWNLQHHRDKFFVVGEGAETACSTTEDDGDGCPSGVGLWSSPDGTNWARVFASSGESVASYEIGSGQLGLVAVGTESWDQVQLPRPIYLSADATEWERAGTLSLFHPGNYWWWIQRPAVGTDRVLLPGSAFDQDSELGDAPFLIVGRLVDT